MKRKHASPEILKRRPKTLFKRLIKLSKVMVLFFLLIQTLFLDLLPIKDQSSILTTGGTTLYFLGLAIAVIGRFQIGRNWVDLEDYQLLPDQSLVTTGIYGYIRHAIYAGDVLLLVGLELALGSWLVLGISLLIPILIRQAIAEEILLTQAFPEYEAYSTRTKRFIPFVL